MSGPFQHRFTRDVVVVTGPDATSFLQSLVSQDLDAVPVGATAPSLLLQPQGKLLADFRAHHAADDAWSCDCEAGFGAALAEGLRRFKIRVKADITTRTAAALAVRGRALDDALHVPEGVMVLPVLRGSWIGADVLGADDDIDAVAAALALREVTADEYERARIEAGVPRQGLDVDERTIPQEALLERDAVSFTKGCFVGQELVCRIDTRGHVNRQLRRLRAEEDLAPGDEVRWGDKVVGTVTSASGEVGLAMLRREVPAGTDVAVGTRPVRARVEALA